MGTEHPDYRRKFESFAAPGAPFAAPVEREPCVVIAVMRFVGGAASCGASDGAMADDPTCSAAG